MRVHAFLAVGLFLSSGVHAQESTWTIDKREVNKWTPLLQNKDKLFIVAASINGKDTTALIDTGTNTIVVSEGYSEKESGIYNLSSPSGDLAGKSTNIKSLKFSSLNIQNETVFSANLSNIIGVNNKPVGVVLGSVVLEKVAMEFDRERMRVRYLDPNKTPKYHHRYAIKYNPITRNIETDITLCGTLKIKARLDTGLDGLLEFTDQVRGNAHCFYDKKNTQSIDATGQYGSEILKVKNVDVLGKKYRDASVGMSQKTSQNGRSLPIIGISAIPFKRFIIDVRRGYIFDLS